MSQRKPWRKALWCPQYYPDNHTDENFLESLVINADVVQRSYKRVVFAALAIDQQVCLTSIVASIAYHLYQGTLSAETVFLWETGLFLGGATLLTILSRTQKIKSPQHQPLPLRQLLLQLLHQGASTAALVALTAVLSPVYATLTASISPDTIVASAVALLLAHLYLHDYKKPAAAGGVGGGGLSSGGGSGDGSIEIRYKNGFNSYSGPSLRGSLGLACAMCSSVLMASQLRQLQDVFALMVLSLEFYILGPSVQYTLMESSPALHAMLLVALIFTAARLISASSVVLTSLLLCTLGCITLLCPMWLIRIHKFKAQINGPWDQAAPKLDSFKIKTAASVAASGGTKKIQIDKRIN